MDLLKSLHRIGAFRDDMEAVDFAGQLPHGHPGDLVVVYDQGVHILKIRILPKRWHGITKF
jgi:hypothetical protein